MVRGIHPPTSVSQRQKLVTRAANLLALSVGFGTAFSVHFVGDLYVSEILLVIAGLPLLILRRQMIVRRELKMVYGLLVLWLLGLAIADIYNHIPLLDRVRGSALIVFFGIDLLCMSMILGSNEKRKIVYVIGLMLGSLAVVKLQPSEAVADYPWKFGYASGTILLVVLVSAFLYDRRRFFVSAILIVGICVLNLLLNYRGPVLQLLIMLAIVYPIIPERFGNSRILPNSQIVRVVLLAAFAIGAAMTAQALVNAVTALGFISEQAQAKNEAQSNSGNLLLGGRPEFLVGLRAALDSPIIGHGSWAKDPKYFEMLYDMLVETGAQPEGGEIEGGDFNGLIPGHSQIVTAWVWAGIAGLIFWLYVAWLLIKAIVRVAILRPPSAPLYMWLLIGMFWNVFFSPFAANRRLIEAFVLIVVADLLGRRIPGTEKSRLQMRVGGRRSRFRPRGSVSTLLSR